MIETIDMSEYESPNGLVNYTRNDCIIDYLEILKKNKLMIDMDNLKKRKISMDDEETIKKKPKIEIKKVTKKNKVKATSTLRIKDINKCRPKTSIDYIFDNGNKFEEDILNEIRNKMIINNQGNKLCEIKKKDILEQYNETVSILIKKKHDLILGGLLINSDNNTFGYPDMIVSGYWINKYITDKIVDVEYNRNKYYIIDIKSSTIQLINGGEYVSSGLLYNSYKQQIYIYMKALNKIFRDHKINNEVNIGFILGKKYRYILNKNEIIVNNPFERLGIINYNYEVLHNNNYEDIIKNALIWKSELKKNWKRYKLNRINKNELYPNMKNCYDKNYRKIKKNVAYKNKELTLLWNVGIKNRKLAWNNNIKNYDNKKLTSNILGFKDNSKRTMILDKMLKMVHSDELVLFDNNNNYMEWQNEQKYEFYIDFETYNNEMSYDDSINGYFNKEEITEINDNQVIYMIGVVKDDVYKCFIIRYSGNNNKKSIKNIKKKMKKMDNIKCDSKCYILCENELDLINKFVEYINSFKPEQILIEDYYKACRLIHWSYAEPILYNKKMITYNLREDKKYKLPWYDLLKIYKHEDNPIILKECFSFGLKEIVKKLNEYNFIELSWPELDDGLLSSFIANDIYNNKINEKDINIIKIVEYNYIDCIAIHKILIWMRSLL